MGVSLVAGQDLDILLDRHATIEYTCLHIGHVLAEALVLGADLVSQLAGVAHDQDRSFAGNRFDLLETGQNEDGCLAETGLGLAKDIAPKDGLGNAESLDCSHRVRFVSKGLVSRHRASVRLSR
jgi:hypothetical protein